MTHFDGKKPRVLIGFTEIAGYYKNLTEGLKACGIPCDFITISPHQFGYGGTTARPLLLKPVGWLQKMEEKPDRSSAALFVCDFLNGFFRLLYALFAVLRYDVFIFGFGDSLLPKNLDLPILKLLGKRIIVNMYHGSEARPPYIDGAFKEMEGDRSETVTALKNLSRFRKKRLAFMQKHSDFVIGAPFSTTQFAIGPLINGLALGLPYSGHPSPEPELRGCKNSIGHPGDHPSEKAPAAPVRILHAPSVPEVKGTYRIREAIENLRAKGYAIEYMEVKNKPNKEVIEEIKSCDFVVDQLYSDTPMAVLATEAAWYGKPSVVGGYALDYLKNFLPPAMIPPSKTCHPEDIERAMEEMIVNEKFRQELGRKAEKFVKEKLAAKKVAERYLKIIQGDIPDEWRLDPKAVFYLHGAGLSAESIKRRIRDLVAAYGKEALQLSHRPDLERAFLQFSGLEAR